MLQFNKGLQTTGHGESEEYVSVSRDWVRIAAFYGDDRFVNCINFAYSIDDNPGIPEDWVK